MEGATRPAISGGGPPAPRAAAAGPRSVRGGGPAIDRGVGTVGDADGRLGLHAPGTMILGSHGGHDAEADGADDRLIEEAVGLVVGHKERLDPSPQLRIARALTVQDGGPVR